MASFFVSRVDTEVDRRLEAMGDAKWLSPFGAKPLWRKRSWRTSCSSSGSPARAGKLCQAKGAHRQRPLWASTSTKNPAYPDLLYVDNLIGPDTVNTMPDATVAAFLDHGIVARTIDRGADRRGPTWTPSKPAGIDMADVSAQLEDEGVAAFSKSYDELLQALEDKANEQGQG